MGTNTQATQKPIEVELSSADMGDVDESDFDHWAAYVTEHLEERMGQPVTVSQRRFGECGPDSISHRRADTREAIADLWQEWCSHG